MWKTKIRRTFHSFPDTFLLNVFRRKLLDHILLDPRPRSFFLYQLSEWDQDIHILHENPHQWTFHLNPRWSNLVESIKKSNIQDDPKSFWRWPWPLISISFHPYRHYEWIEIEDLKHNIRLIPKHLPQRNQLSESKLVQEFPNKIKDIQKCQVWENHVVNLWLQLSFPYQSVPECPFLHKVYERG